MKYVQSLNGRFIYRRAVPERFRDSVGKREIKIPLGRTETEMMKQYPDIHYRVEKLLKDLSKPQKARPPSNPSEQTELDRFNEAVERIREIEWSEDISLADEEEREHR